MTPDQCQIPVDSVGGVDPCWPFQTMQSLRHFCTGFTFQTWKLWLSKILSHLSIGHDACSGVIVAIANSDISYE